MIENRKEIVICTVRYSENLGDGVIGDCLEFLLKKEIKDINVVHFDMAGRSGFVSHKENSYLTRRIFYMTPRFARSILVYIAWSLKMKPRIKKIWSNSDFNEKTFLVFGGGQILSDVALNFPLKFNYIQKLASKKGMRIAVHGVGVSRKWSYIGRSLFSKSILNKSVKYISTRDSQSSSNLEKHISLEGFHSETTVDPAIWASEVYSLKKIINKKKDRKIIGLGVIHPSEIHKDKVQVADIYDFMIDFWIGLVGVLNENDFHPVFFTNGSIEDEVFLKDLISRCPVDVDRNIKPESPEELVKGISFFDAVVAYRLHANIISYALSIPNLSLVWDDKVESFANLTDRSAWCLKSQVTPAAVLNILLDDDFMDVDEAKLKELKKCSIDNVRKMNSFIIN